jgi:putative (di)nucleoside polyphosphate hydrolase
MAGEDVTYVSKACTYVTREGSELLTFEGPGHGGLQIPKGTVEPGEHPRGAAYRETVEETGLAALGDLTHVATDVWTRRESPPRRYVRHFYHVQVHEPRDEWVHTVTGSGAEEGTEFALSWEALPTTKAFALDLDDYLHVLETEADGDGEVVAD